MKQRVRFTKLGKIRFLSHRDLARVWERGLRRAGVRVAYSEGFSPRPRLSFGLALSTGYESLGEYLDIDLHPDADVSPAELPELVTASLPDGMTAQVAVPLAAGTESLQAAVTSSTWQIEVVGADPDALVAAVDRALGADELPIDVERKAVRTTIDARPAILRLVVHPGGLLEAELGTQPRSLRPAELIRALEPTWREGRVLRTHQWTLVDGARCEPVPFGGPGARGATSTPHAGARAS